MSEAPSASAQSGRPRVVIVGGGFGGLAAAQRLRHAPARVQLVDQRNHHLFQPMLYQVAMAQVLAGNIAEPLRGLFGADSSVRPRMDAVSGIDLDARRVAFVSGQSTGYDMLVLATGGRYQYLGHPQWAQHVLTLKSLTQALTMRERIFSALEMADRAGSDAERRAHLTFVIVGAGSTGVELGGALGRLLPGIVRNQFPELAVSELRIVIADPKPHALAGMNEGLSRYADKKLRGLNVELMTGVAVEDIEAGQVQLEGERTIRTATIIWAAGMEGNGAGDWLPEDLVDKSNRVPVGTDLTAPGHPEVFVVGDSATAKDPDGNPYPGLAAVAKQQGDYVGRVIRAQLDEAAEGPPQHFHYTDYGTMAIISNGCAVGEIRGHNVKGLVAWLLWGMVHLYSLVSVRKRALVLTSWLWAMLTGRGQRVILGEVQQSAARERTAPEPETVSDNDKETVS